MKITSDIIKVALDLQRLDSEHGLLSHISLFQNRDPAITFEEHFFAEFTPEGGKADDALVEFLAKLEDAVEDAESSIAEPAAEAPHRIIVDA